MLPAGKKLNMIEAHKKPPSCRFLSRRLDALPRQSAARQARPKRCRRSSGYRHDNLGSAGHLWDSDNLGSSGHSAAPTTSEAPATSAPTTSEAPATSAAPATSVASTATETDDIAVVNDRRDVVDRQKEAFGGMKFGSCFFGWLTAAGTAVLLGAIVTGVGTALGMTRNVETAGTTPAGTESVGLIGGIILLAIIFVSYLAGGYVAGRMARFNGLTQGLGVWLWAVIIAILAAGAGMLAGARFDILTRVNSLPRLPLSQGTLNTGGIILAIGIVAVSLIGALLGGLAGMRYHRRG